MLAVKQSIYVACEDPKTAVALNKVLTGGGYACESFSDGRSVLAAIKAKLPDLLALDLVLPDDSGIEVLKKVRRIAPTLPVIMMAERVSVTTAVAALKLGATDFLESPRDPGRVLVAARHALETTDMQRQLEHLRDELQERYKMVGESAGMKRVWNLIRRVAPTAASVLITGESGVGKELVARAIHLQSPRAARPFVPLNCAAIPKDLIESELFGHEKGAFTGAGTARMGKIQEADAGTLFLDEIGDLSLSAQAKLLRFLNDSEVQRVGGNTVIHLDARVVAATNKDLHELIKQNLYRAAREGLLAELQQGPLAAERCAEYRQAFEGLVSAGEFADIAIHLFAGAPNQAAGAKTAIATSSANSRPRACCSTRSSTSTTTRSAGVRKKTR